VPHALAAPSLVSPLSLLSEVPVLEPLVVPFASVPMLAFVAGDVVENFGAFARVRSVDARGLVLEARDFGGPVRWIADPSKCRPVR